MAVIEDSWIIVGSGIDEAPDRWDVKIHDVEPLDDMLCTCAETGAIFRIEIAGGIHGTVAARYIRCLKVHLVSGEARLQGGFHLIPHAGTGKPSEVPDWLKETAEDVLREEIQKLPPSLQATVIIAAYEDIDIRRPGPWILFIYDALKRHPPRPPWKWIDSLRILFRVLVETNAGIAVVAIAQHMLDPMFQREHLFHIWDLSEIRRGRGVIWFRDHEAYAALPACTEENIATVKRFTEEAMRSRE